MQINKSYSIIYLLLIIVCQIGCTRNEGIIDDTGVVTLSVTSTSPADGATGVAVNTNLVATFSVEMVPSSITASSFTLVDSANNSILGAVTYNNKIATFNPTNDLAYNTPYTAN
jgi:hypothetical protein